MIALLRLRTRRFRFTLTALFVFIAVSAVAMAVGQWATRQIAATHAVRHYWLMYEWWETGRATVSDLCNASEQVRDAELRVPFSSRLQAHDHHIIRLTDIRNKLKDGAWLVMEVIEHEQKIAEVQNRLDQAWLEYNQEEQRSR